MNKTIAGNDTIWKICIYVRLSKEEIRKNKTESESIINQKSILLSWIDQYFSTERHTVYGIFEDDGISGTDDEREGFVPYAAGIGTTKGKLCDRQIIITGVSQLCRSGILS